MQLCPPGDYPSTVISRYFVLQTGSWQVSTEALSALAHQSVALALSRNHIHRTQSFLNPWARPSILLSSWHPGLSPSYFLGTQRGRRALQPSLTFHGKTDAVQISSLQPWRISLPFCWRVSRGWVLSRGHFYF